MPYLSLAIWIPIAAGLAVLVYGRDRDAGLARWIALVGALAGLLVTLPLWVHFNPHTSDMQFVESAEWIPRFDVRYLLGVDGISMLFVLLNSFVTLLVVWAGWEVIEDRVAQYMAAFLIMSGLINGSFVALDGVLFYVFFEALLIPMYLIIGVWGGPNRVYAAVKFFLYTLVGSLLMLVALIYLYRHRESSRCRTGTGFRCRSGPDRAVRRVLPRLFGQGADVAGPHLVARCPRRGAHRRLGRAGGDHAQARRLRLRPLHPPHPARRLALPLRLHRHAVAGGGGLHRLRRAGPDRHEEAHRLLVDLAHGVRHAGLLPVSPLGVEGALAQMISHGFVSAAMFLCVGVLYDRMHSRQIADYGGVVHTMPKFAAFMVFFAMANAGLPATSGFVGEFLVILGAVKANPWLGFAAALTLILGAAYTLWMVKRVVFGAVANPHVAALADVSRREFWLLAVVAVAVLAMGIWPKPFVDVMHVSVIDLLAHVAKSKL
jgi:NADH-quinone oxidoreductase subunit M